MTGANAKIKRILVRPNGVENQVRPAGWTPGSNTIAYFPFVDDTSDHSGNGATLSSTGTKQNLGYSFYTGSGNTITISMNNIGNVKWFCAWQKLDNASGPSGPSTFYDTTSMGWSLHDTGIGPHIWTFYTSSYARASIALSDVNNWHLYGIGFDGENTVYGIDGTYGILRNGVGYNFGNTFALQSCSNNASGTVINSNFIAESKCWSVDEYTKYYNLTKSNYGL